MVRPYGRKVQGIGSNGQIIDSRAVGTLLGKELPVAQIPEDYPAAIAAFPDDAGPATIWVNGDLPWDHFHVGGPQDRLLLAVH